MSRQSEAGYLYGRATERPQADLAAEYGRSKALVSHVFTGRRSWTPEFEAAVFTIIGDSEKIVGIKQAAQRAYRERRESTDA